MQIVGALGDQVWPMLPATSGKPGSGKLGCGASSVTEGEQSWAHFCGVGGEPGGPALLGASCSGALPSHSLSSASCLCLALGVAVTHSRQL